jgi:hypothetical protein
MFMSRSATAELVLAQGTPPSSSRPVKCGIDIILD